MDYVEIKNTPLKVKRQVTKQVKIFAMHTNDKEPEYRIHKIFYKLIKKINNFKMGSIHFMKEDNRIGKGAHPYRSWEKCKFKPQKAKIKRNDNCHC